MYMRMRLTSEGTFMNWYELSSKSSLFIRDAAKAYANTETSSCKLCNYTSPCGKGSIIYVEWELVCQTKETLKQQQQFRKLIIS